MARKTNTTINGHNYFRIRRTVGKDKDGKPVIKSFYGEGKAEAERKAAECMERLKSGQKADGSIIQMAKYYCDHVLPGEGLASGSVKLYTRGFKNIQECEALFCDLSDFNSEEVQLYLNKMSSESARTESLRFLRRFAKYLMRTGVKYDISAPLVVKKERKAERAEVFTPEEVQRLLSTPSYLHEFVLLAVSSGLRLSELIALDCDDLKDGCVAVSKQWDREERRETPPKSAAGYRTVPLPSSVYGEIRAFAEGRTGLLFPSLTGSHLDKRNINRSWQRLTKAAGVRYIKFHALRATYCTMLARSGVPLETAAKLMGHSSVAVTAKFYRAVSADELEHAANAISHFLATE